MFGCDCTVGRVYRRSEQPNANNTRCLRDMKVWLLLCVLHNELQMMFVAWISPKFAQLLERKDSEARRRRSLPHTRQPSWLSEYGHSVFRGGILAILNQMIFVKMAS